MMKRFVTMERVDARVRKSAAMCCGALALMLAGVGCNYPVVEGGVGTPAANTSPTVTLTTSQGQIRIELFTQQGQAAQNFYAYYQEGYYSDIVFDEIETGVWLKGGQINADGEPLPDKPLINESDNGLRHLQGRVALYGPADVQEGVPHFIIHLQDNPDFDYVDEPVDYTVIGRVIEGFDLLEQISQNEGPNDPPIAQAGADRNAVAGVVVGLDGSATVDDDGDELTYRWEQLTGTPVTLDNDEAVSTTFTVPDDAPGPFTFELTAEDGRGGEASDTVTISVVTDPLLRLETTLGTVDLFVLIDGAPLNALNVLQYVEDGFYDGTIFHRVMADFVVQGGGYLPGLEAKTGLREPVVNEFGEDRSNVRGTVAMAKLGGDPDSATSQFFFNLVDNAENLDNQNGGFTVWARVTEATMTVVDAMGGVEVAEAENAQGTVFEDVPVVDIVIEEATILSAEDQGITEDDLVEPEAADGDTADG